MADSEAITLQSWANQNQLGAARLSSDGTKLDLDSATLDASKRLTITHSGKTCEYSLASIYLQILDPTRGLLPYRNACKQHNVDDPVKPVHKGIVVAFFLGDDTTQDATVTATPAAVAKPPADTAAVAASTATAPPLVPAKSADTAATETSQSVSKPDVGASEEAAGEAAESSKHHRDGQHHDKHRHRHHDRHKSSSKHHRESSKRKHSSSSSADPKKVRKAPATIDKEKLFSNLNVVVDKRFKPSKEEEEKNRELHLALNPEGFSVTPELLEQHRETSQTILAGEIPVGNSASILQAAAGKDLSRILKLYMDTVNPPKSSSKAASSASSQPVQKKGFRAHLVGKKPIIVLPKGMTAPLTLLNAHEFFANSKFVPREVIMKQGLASKNSIPTTFSRRVAARSGGGVVEYELMDNPKNKLQSPQDWDRVVAVVALGASWQFKDWPGPYKNPVHLFSHTFGFYVGMEGDKIPSELQKWAVVHAKLNRDKRGLDSVTYASFWNGLDEFMAIHKPEMLPQEDN